MVNGSLTLSGDFTILIFCSMLKSKVEFGLHHLRYRKLPRMIDLK